MAAIDTAMEAITTAWNAASQEIYAATQGQEGGANPMDGFGGQPGGGQPNGNGSQGQPTDGDVSDVPYEEVK